MTHRHINTATELGSDFGSPARTERIRNRLKDERAACRSAASDYDRHVAENNVANLEEVLERAEANQAAKEEHRARVAQERADKTTAHQAAEQAKVEAQLRQEYNRALPTPVTDEQWNEVRADVLHQHRLRTMNRTDELVAASRRYRI